MKTHIARILTSFAALTAATINSYAQYTYTALEYPGAVQTSARSISDAHIAGFYIDTNGVRHGFLYDGGAWIALNHPLAGSSSGQGTDAIGISGTNVVGSYVNSNGILHGYFYNGGAWTDLDDPQGLGGAYPCGISGVNIVGYYYDSYGAAHGFLYNGNHWTQLDDPQGFGATFACGFSGNNTVGFYFDSHGCQHGFIDNDGPWTTLDNANADLARGGSFAQGVSGDNVVGSYYDSRGNVHGFLYNIATTICASPLDDPVAPPGHNPTGGVYLRGVSGAQIVGDYYENGNAHGFLATPTPRLNIVNTSNRQKISWPYNPLAHWAVEQNSDLKTANWVPVGVSVTNDGVNNSVTLPPASGSMFFRLRP